MGETMPEWIDYIEARKDKRVWTVRLVGNIPDTRYWNRANFIRHSVEGQGATYDDAFAAAIAASATTKPW